MIVYFVSLTIAFLFAHLAYRTKDDKVSRRVFIALVFLTMVLVAGLRSSNVGTDTNNYVGYFNTLNVSFGKVFGLSTSFGVGFIVLAFFARILSHDYMSFLSLIAIVVVFFQLSSTFRYSKQPPISLFVLITLGFYSFFFNGARQGLAMAIFMMSIGAVIKGNYLKYFFWVILGSFFHISVLFTLPFYFLFRAKISVRFFLIVSISLILIALFMQPLLNIGNALLSERYSQFLSRGATGAGLLTIFFTLATIFFVIVRQIIAKNDKQEYDVLLSMTIIGTLIYILVFFFKLDVNVVRFANYFHLAIVFIWPFIFRSIQDSAKLIIGITFFMVHIAFYFIQLREFSNLIPYEFNPVL